MRFARRLATVGLFLFLGGVAVAACAAESEDCGDNETRACVCTGGVAGAQTCTGGAWSVCSCDEGGGDGGGGGGGGEPDAGGGGDTVHHGDTCFAPEDCGVGTDLICIVDNEGDTQGVCRAECGDFSECLQDPDASGQFDTDC